ncbi:unnamed protein product [Aphanomyces euteiches]|uniref:Protein kinase domain-containing protein n=1 Tax=Aphanomyces euteiches TaxID=100861 RepID=A0A6G0XTL1_9STRA|nr:hypothetical protein Ae201684_001416 [Aphanomyces euteiches]KAH9075064.1 hypothetical protein Ae201684P_003749 [Aphanomyces euteiches]KAH9141285.1 hypothetical protein AeRB84_014486 [Aphanomyces euteiches]KAH9142319.1 hypothetical protein AeRB84_013588 [Aphanomyces euteiches]KAH9146516.1 hypothetical protein AeRB84_009621 [Aphanomyces euteiches]
MSEPDAVVLYVTSMFETILLQSAVAYLIMLMFSLGLILYLRLTRQGAYEGDTLAARHVILPTFEPLLWTLVVALLIYTTFLWIAVALDFTAWLFHSIALLAVYAGRQFIFLVVLLYFYQNSVSIQALGRAVTAALALSLFPVALEGFAKWIHLSEVTTYALQTVYRLALCLLYLWMFRWPRSRASVWSLRAFCVYFLTAQALAIVYYELYRHEALIHAATMCVVVSGYYDSALPLFVWWLLRADTSHWRGMGQRVCSLQTLAASTTSAENAIHEITSAQGLHLLIEMHRKHVIDFAYLNIISRIGRGASADVYKGKLHSKIDVAIKVFTPLEINESVIRAFSHEAALSGALDHPNIVAFYGMCVCPPTICLVSELCRGSVHDILATQQLYHLPQHFALDLTMMLDAARAVAYLHSFSPPFIHRDLKPANLMVDRNHVVKITDFGVSKQEQRHLDPRRSSLPQMTVVGTVEYMAPEVIQGRDGGATTYTEAVDIYSLGVTMWDILHPGEDKYPSANPHQIFMFVLEGQRPCLGDHVPAPLSTLIEAAWRTDPATRPSAATIVQTLQGILDDILVPLADQVAQVVQYALYPGEKPHKHLNRHLFRGEHLVDSMFDMEIVHNVPEAVRLGNALMDAGLLHHAKHGHGFDNTPALYFLDAVDDATDTPPKPKSPCKCRSFAQGSRALARSQSSFFRLKKAAADSSLKLKLLDELAVNQEGGISFV